MYEFVPSDPVSPDSGSVATYWCRRSPSAPASSARKAGARPPSAHSTSPASGASRALSQQNAPCPRIHSWSASKASSPRMSRSGHSSHPNHSCGGQGDPSPMSPTVHSSVTSPAPSRPRSCAAELPGTETAPPLPVDTSCGCPHPPDWRSCETTSSPSSAGDTCGEYDGDTGDPTSPEGAGDECLVVLAGDRGGAPSVSGVLGSGRQSVHSCQVMPLGPPVSSRQRLQLRAVAHSRRPTTARPHGP